MGTGQCTAYANFGAPCASDLRCKTDLFCTSSSQCEPRRKPGEACLTDTCVASAWCHFTPQDGGICADRFGSGVDCTDDVQCQQGLLCEPLTGKCEPVGPLLPGAACSLRQSCAPGSVCLGVSANELGVCGAPKVEGEPCVVSSDCEQHLACAAADGGPKKCGPRFSEGTPCTASRDCRAFDRCINGSCKALPFPGQSCLAGACVFGVCEPADAGYSVCGDMGGPGDPCFADGECQSNRCLAGRCLAACAP
jgi:hypothetical protein